VIFIFGAASNLARPARLIRSTVSSSNGTDFPSASARKPSATSVSRSVMTSSFVKDKRISECRTRIDWQSLPSSFFFYKSPLLCDIGLPNLRQTMTHVSSYLWHFNR
jgi:hypothetical protein